MSLRGIAIDGGALENLFVAGGTKAWVQLLAGDRQVVIAEVILRELEGIPEFIGGDWFNVCNWLDTIDAEKTTKKFRNLWGQRGDAEFYFSKSKISGHHVWIDKFATSAMGILISNKMHDALVQRALPAWISISLTKQIEPNLGFKSA